jgi:hypothetical protein
MSAISAMLSPSVILSEVRVNAREPKDSGAAVGDHADSGSSTETLFLFFFDHAITRDFPITRSALGLFCRSTSLRDDLHPVTRNAWRGPRACGMTSQALLAIARVSLSAQVMP